MKPNSSEAAVYTDSVEVQEHLSVELDLYSDLRTFEDSTPEERARLPIHTELEREQDNSPEAVAKPTEYVADLGNTPLCFVDSTVGERESVSDDVEQQSLSDEDANVIHPQTEGDPGNSDNESSLTAFDNDHEEFEPSELGSGSLTSELVQAVASEPKMDGAATGQTNVEDRSETIEAASDVFVTEIEPLESLDSGVEFTGALSRGVCLACGAESSTDDLFCPACDVSIEDIT